MPPPKTKIESKMTIKARYKVFAENFVRSLDPVKAGSVAGIKNPVKVFATDEMLREIVREQFDEFVELYNSIPVDALKAQLIKISISDKSTPSQQTQAIKELKNRDWKILEDKADAAGGLLAATQQYLDDNKEKD